MIDFNELGFDVIADGYLRADVVARVEILTPHIVLNIDDCATVFVAVRVARLPMQSTPIIVACEAVAAV